MKFTVVLLAALCVSSSWAVKVQKTEEPKDKREAPVGYPTSHNYQSPSLGQEEASAISVGAGYSVGGAKPSYSLEGSSGGAQYQLSPESYQQPGGHGNYQLAPITLQPGHGQAYSSSDLSQLMSQLSHGLNSGALTLQSGEGYQQAAHGGGQELTLPAFTFAGPKVQQYAVAEQPSVPSYAAGTKGLGSYSTGPVLFSPSDSHGQIQGLSYGIPNSGHSLGSASASGHFLNAPSSGHGFGGLSSSSLSNGHSFGDGGFSLGGSGHSFPGLSVGGHGSFGGSIKGLSSGYGAPSKNSFKPSAFLGASVQGESGHGLSSLSGSHGAPSFGAFSDLSNSGFSLGSGAAHGASFGGSFPGFGGSSSKFLAPSYLPSKSIGFGSSLESVASFASDGHFASPPGTTYGVPTSSYGLPSSASQAASSASPQYYVPSKSSSSFGGGSSSYRGPSSSHGSLSSLSSGPKHIYSSHSGPRYGHPKDVQGAHSETSYSGSGYGHPKDVQGAHSETSYNTIKYSEELKPRAH